MKIWSCVQFAKLLGGREVSISDDNLWCRTNCPLAPFTHAKGIDENPSFGIRANDEGESGFHCFTCGSGRLADLIHRMLWTTGIRKDALDFYSLHENFGEEREDVDPTYYRDIYEQSIKDIVESPIPQRVLNSHPHLEDSEYNYERTKCLEKMLERGIFPEVLYKYGVLHKPYDRAIAFPLKGKNNITYAIHYLSREKKQFWYLKPKYFEYPESTHWGSPLAMFGLNLYDSKKPLILVESETDLLRLASLGVDEQFCVLATCGTPTREKISQLRSRVQYNGYDADPTGNKYHVRTLKFTEPDVTVYKLDWSLVVVTNKRTGELRPAKDAGDLESREQFDYVLSKRRQVANQIFLTSEYKDAWS